MRRFPSGCFASTVRSPPMTSASSEQLGRLLSIPDLAECLAISERHVRRLVSERRIPYLKIGHLVRFDRAVVDQWLTGREIPERTSGRFRL
jgi:excisionase family DNA binding protein